MSADFISGAGGVILGVLISVVVDMWRENRREGAARRRFAAALLAEMTALRERQREVVGEALDRWREGEPLEVGGSVSVTNMFPVFDHNTDKLGLFESADAEAVVRTYALGKAHLESLAVFRNTIADLKQQRATVVAMGQGTRGSVISNRIEHVTKVDAVRLRTEAKALDAAAETAMIALKRYAPRHGKKRA